jgi:hypothetical protein
MAARFVTNMIETVERTMQSLQERERLKRDGRALKSLRANVARRIAEVGLPQRGNSLTVDSKAANTKLPRNR